MPDDTTVGFPKSLRWTNDERKMKLTGFTALVTGASGGIGEEVEATLARPSVPELTNR